MIVPVQNAVWLSQLRMLPIVLRLCIAKAVTRMRSYNQSRRLRSAPRPYGVGARGSVKLEHVNNNRNRTDRVVARGVCRFSCGERIHPPPVGDRHHHGAHPRDPLAESDQVTPPAPLASRGEAEISSPLV